ncbi:hypothetical protein L873DRAFT_1924288 [Choiromyces venosus 120613-1]|uniref:Uncharacterized protein n=1 Tax=Choiromyces venosus 120613-1 TaxID=1336337 RepID=A0A3N4JEP5_9PEZI|nr:hypothetical protein L873DRAFT_1924288 [Choiromyces venosus 120613-1]
MSFPDSQTEKRDPPPGHLPQATTETKSPLANTPTQKKPALQSTRKPRPTQDQSSSGAPQHLADTRAHRLKSPSTEVLKPDRLKKEMQPPDLTSDNESSPTSQPQNNPPYHTTPNQPGQQPSVFLWGSTGSPRPAKKNRPQGKIL